MNNIQYMNPLILYADFDFPEKLEKLYMSLYFLIYYSIFILLSEFYYY